MSKTSRVQNKVNQAASVRGLTGNSRWHQLHMKRQAMLRRFESYAEVTIPKVCLPDNTDNNNVSLQHDWTSVGAQATNHLTNKIVLNLFRPGMPFFRLDPDKKMKQELAQKGISEDDLRASLVDGEQEALKVMDQKAIRPKINEAVRNLIVVGNVALDMTDDTQPRVIGIRHYVVKRSISGRLQEILIAEKVLFNELDEEVKPFVQQRSADAEDAYTEFVRWYARDKDGKWQLSQHVDNTRLPKQFDHTYTNDTMPVHILTWDLADEMDYGTGLVEDYAGDFGTLSTLTEAEIKASLLASDFRWLANPAGVGDIEEFRNSVSGDVIPGAKDDLSLVALTSGQGIELISKSADKVIRRIGQAFLLNSAVTRDAERVTAEEIRMQAQELETSLGGVYSRLAIDLQLPVAVWLLKQIDVNIKGTHLVPTIVTGLAALSRNAEAQQLGVFLSSLAQVATMPPEVLQRLNLSAVISTLASANGIDPNKYVKPEAQVAKEQAAAQQAAVNQQATVDASKAGAQAMANRQQDQTAQ